MKKPRIKTIGTITNIRGHRIGIKYDSQKKQLLFRRWHSRKVGTLSLLEAYELTQGQLPLRLDRV